MRLFVLSIMLIFIALNASAQNTSQSKNDIFKSMGVPVAMFNGEIIDGLTLEDKTIDGVIIYYLNSPKPLKTKAEDFAGVYFDDLPSTNPKVAIWRYKPWNSWSKPIGLKSALLMPDNDVQLFYWRNSNGLYGAAVPISGQGFRTTLGSQGDKWGSKCTSLTSGEIKGSVPAMAVAFDKNPYVLFSKIYKACLQVMDRSENLRSKKQLPEPFKYLGWCTWNSSEMGKDLSENEVIAGVKTFSAHDFPLGWVLIDDGWFQSKDGKLQSQFPDPKKFPNGFSGMNSRLKKDFGVKYIGVWHAFNGYWNGIDRDSEIGEKYKNDLFSWTQGGGTWMDTSTNKKTFHFIKPESESLEKFYDTWYSYFKTQGFDFTKVDNQLVSERMSFNNYPVFTLSSKIHHAIYKASTKYFKGALINCMDMTPDAYLNFGTSAVARTVEDYFPYKPDEGYNLEQGNAAAHVLQAIYNSLYFSQMVYPDFDMFESNNPNATYHAIARALNCGPIYITDKPGSQNFNILNALIYHDGRIVNSPNPLLPTADCLFQIQDKKLFKAFTSVGKTGLIAIFNAADTDKVTGQFCAADVNGIQGNKFVIYEHFSESLEIGSKRQLYRVTLPKLGYKLYYVVPVKSGFAPLGLTGKYNAPATILRQSVNIRKADLVLYEGGLFKAFCTRKPKSVLINGKLTRGSYRFQGGVLAINVPQNNVAHPTISINW